LLHADALICFLEPLRGANYFVFLKPQAVPLAINQGRCVLVILLILRYVSRLAKRISRRRSSRHLSQHPAVILVISRENQILVLLSVQTILRVSRQLGFTGLDVPLILPALRVRALDSAQPLVLELILVQS
jgi:hypothetical protein